MVTEGAWWKGVEMIKKILQILENDARTTPEQIATMTGMTEAEVRTTIEEAERDRAIVKYKTMMP